jgi:RNA polymerase sigma-70 factor (ECF subfamily)
MATEGDELSELMRSYATGKNSSFERLYTLLAPRLNRFCRRLTRDRTEAEDILQETFLRLHRARATYISGANPLYWAFAIARSVYLDRFRYRSRRPEDVGSQSDIAEDNALQADDHYRPDAALQAYALWDVITLQLQKMSEKNRIAYVLLREEGLSVNEAAALLGTTEAAVKQRAHRAYEQLRNAISAAGWEKDDHDSRRYHTSSIRI